MRLREWKVSGRREVFEGKYPLKKENRGIYSSGGTGSEKREGEEKELKGGLLNVVVREKGE